MQATHLCQICHVVEMVFVERIPSKKHFSMRRFKCPVCDHQEMYTCGGPDDKGRERRAKETRAVAAYRRKHNA